MGGARIAQGCPRRRASSARRPAGVGGEDGLQPGQILYRVAELMEGRRSQFEGELKDAGAKDPAKA